MLRAVGSAAGVAISTAIQYSVMEASLPATLPPDLRTQVLDGDWSLGQPGSNAWAGMILDAKMQGLHVVFVTFLPLMGLCLAGCLLLKDKILAGDAKPKQESQEAAKVALTTESKLLKDLENGHS
jgi:hypothetical protein